MQSEPIYTPFFATPEQRDEFIEKFNLDYGGYGFSQGASRNDFCACGQLIGKVTEGIRLRQYISEMDNQWRPQMFHSTAYCGLDESDLQAECQGPIRKHTGAYVGCTNCEPYVRLCTTRDSAYVYSVQFNDFDYEVFEGDTKLEGILEVKVGVGGYIIQVRYTPEAHMCPCYLTEDDPEVEAKVCRLYLPGNNYRVVELEKKD